MLAPLNRNTDQMPVSLNVDGSARSALTPNWCQFHFEYHPECDVAALRRYAAVRAETDPRFKRYLRAAFLPHCARVERA